MVCLMTQEPMNSVPCFDTCIAKSFGLTPCKAETDNVSSLTLPRFDERGERSRLACPSDSDSDTKSPTVSEGSDSGKLFTSRRCREVKARALNRVVKRVLSKRTGPVGARPTNKVD